MYCLRFFFFYVYGDHRDLHLLTHSFPTRRSSDLVAQRMTVGDRHGVRGALHPLDRGQLAVVQPDGARLAGAGDGDRGRLPGPGRSEEHTSELQSLMRISYAVF